MKDIKFISIVLIVATMIGLSILKCFIKEMDVSQINTVLLSILTGLGVYNRTSAKPEDETK